METCSQKKAIKQKMTKKHGFSKRTTESLPVREPKVFENILEGILKRVGYIKKDSYWIKSAQHIVTQEMFL